jgi:hypothetical protein
MPFEMVIGALRAEDINLSIKCRCSSRILRFELLILKGAFLRAIFAFVFVVPVNTAKRSIGCRGHLFNSSSIKLLYPRVGA